MMTTSPTLSSTSGINSTILAASIFITAGSALLLYFQYDIWSGQCKHLIEECEGCSRLEVEYKPSTCESSAACSWAAAMYLGVGMMMLWVEKHRLAKMRAYDIDKAAERKALKISLPHVSIAFAEDETPRGDKMQVV